MLKLFRNQSDMSVATLVFLFAGGIFSVAGGLIFRSAGANNPLMFVAILGLIVIIAGYVFIRGYRLSKFAAGTIITIAALAVLTLSLLTQSPFGAINNGIYFLIIFLYLVWFLPIRFARTVIYPALGIYAVALFMKFDTDLYPLIISILVTTITFGELIYRFKHNLESSSLIDPLTKAWNKRGLERILEQELLTSERNHTTLSVMFIDLDGFKAINDTLGHREGDRVLRELVQEIEAQTRPRDSISRIGGDEFLLVLPDTNEAEALEIGFRMRTQTSFQWSFGVAQYDKTMNAESLIECADRRMFEEKVQRSHSPSEE